MSEKGVINVLYVDDEEQSLVSFKACFRREFNIYTANSARDAELILAKEHIHILITDQKMPVKTGTELLADAIKKYPKQVRILLTGYIDAVSIIDAVNRGQIFKFLGKPWDEEELKKSIKDGYEYYAINAQKENTIKNLELTIKELNTELKRNNNNDNQ